jgi:Holliday junction resolvase
MVDFGRAIKESLIQLDILRYLNGLPSCKAIKVMQANEEGNPDIFCCYRGMMVIMEVKASEKDAWAAMDSQKRQFMQMNQWRDTGATVMYVWSLDMAKYIIGNIGTKI